MNTKLMITFFTLFSLFGCSAQKNVKDKELLSVSYQRTGMLPDDSYTLSISKTNNGYILRESEGGSDGSETYDIAQSDFDKLAEIVLRMKKPDKKNTHYVMDGNSVFRVECREKGKDMTFDYTDGHQMSKKYSAKYNEAYKLMSQILDAAREKQKRNNQTVVQ